MTYLALKWMHVLGAAVLFGTGLGIAFHFWFASRERDARHRVRRGPRAMVVGRFRLHATRGDPAALHRIRTRVHGGISVVLLLDRRVDRALRRRGGACWVPVIFIQFADAEARTPRGGRRPRACR